jgi:hypothetical protein
MKCPKCFDESTETDFCSECGAPMGAPVVIIPVVEPVVVPSDPCPDCSEPRVGDFCAECGYNFLTGEHGEPEEDPAMATAAAILAATPAIIVAPPVAIAVAAPFAYAIPMNLIVQTDSTLNPDPDACPIEEADRVFPIDLEETLIGRRNDTKKVFPDISISGDTGISSRHLKLFANADGGLDVLDLGSANGTVVNGVELQAGVPLSVKIGDQIVIGAWTRLVIAAR